MKQITNNSTKEIIELHKRIEVYLNKSLIDAIRIGELLTLKKSELKHGEYGKWTEENLPFSDRTARNYVNLYKNRKLLKTETVSDLKGAYKLLSGKGIDPFLAWEHLKKITNDWYSASLKRLNTDNYQDIFKLEKEAKWISRELNIIGLRAIRKSGGFLKTINNKN